MTYTIKKKTIKRLYDSVWQKYVSEIDTIKEAERIINSQIAIIQNLRRPYRKEQSRIKYLYGIFLDNELIKKFEI